MCAATLKGSPYTVEPSPTAAELKAKFEHRLQEIAARVDGVVGYEMLAAGDLFVFCINGVFEANDALGREFGAERLLQIVRDTRSQPARAIVDAIFTAVQEFRADTPPNDDMTAVALKITG